MDFPIRVYANRLHGDILVAWTMDTTTHITNFQRIKIKQSCIDYAAKEFNPWMHTTFKSTETLAHDMYTYRQAWMKARGSHHVRKADVKEHAGRQREDPRPHLWVRRYGGAHVEADDGR